MDRPILAEMRCSHTIPNDCARRIIALTAGVYSTQAQVTCTFRLPNEFVFLASILYFDAASLVYS
ncbi:MAG: hypothetical protein ONB24_09490 [candidate division KSB1 bacterium]|nr:hypothetical protein [candidate division KSB1 bacterium]